MRISQSRVKLAAHTELNHASSTRRQTSIGTALPRNTPPLFGTIFDRINQKPTLVAPRQPQENQEIILSANEQQILKRFEFAQVGAEPSRFGSGSSLFGFLNNDYNNSWQQMFRIRFESLQLPTLRFPSLNDLRQQFSQNRSLPTLRHDIFTANIKQEALQFSGEGMVKTEDGKTIQFDFNLVKEQEVATISHAHYTEQPTPMIDPLILDLDGEGFQSNDNFLFDLDSDGILDRILQPSQGSGFLAYDRNGDEMINDGTELFGTVSGNGFADLSQYDLDHNNWIDENDTIYQDLSVWQVGDEGRMTRKTLQEEEVGAIFLGSVTTPMSILAANGAFTGQMRQGGLFLTEAGEARTIHQVDLAKQQA